MLKNANALVFLPFRQFFRHEHPLGIISRPRVITWTVLVLSGLHYAAHYESSPRIYNVGVLMASHLNSPFDLERCGPAVDLALAEVNDFLNVHNVQLHKVQGRYETLCNLLCLLFVRLSFAKSYASRLVFFF